MKKYSSALALAAALALPVAAQAEVEFGGALELNAFTVDDDAGAGEDNTGFWQLLRLGGEFENEDGVKVVTLMNLANTTWEGDTRATGGYVSDPLGNEYDSVVSTGPYGGPFTTGAGDDVTLELGYVTLPLGPGLLSAGRQYSNWANCFVSCDDGRDRITYATRFGTTAVVVGYDKRSEGLAVPASLAGGAPVDPIALENDADAYFGAVVGKVGPVLAGLLLYHVRYEDDFPIPNAAAIGAAIGDANLAAAAAQAGENVTLLSPYFQGKIAGIEASGAFNYTDRAWLDDAELSAYLRGGYDLGVAEVEGQVIWAKDGGVVNQGFDTFSSMINNSPENNQSPTTVATIGGVDDSLLLSFRATGNINEQLKLVAGAGFGTQEEGTAETDVTFLDLQAHYQLTPSTVTWATLGRVSLDPDAAGAADVDYDALSVNLRTEF